MNVIVRKNGMKRKIVQNVQTATVHLRAVFVNAMEIDLARNANAIQRKLTRSKMKLNAPTGMTRNLVLEEASAYAEFVNV